MIAENIQHIRQRIALACARIGRNSDEICLIAVAKTFSAEMIREVVAAGIHDIGENYVQEFLRKRKKLHDENIRWHFIGHLQSNKVKSICPWIHAIHAVDSVELGRHIGKRAQEYERKVDVLVEVNTSGESSKFGIKPDDAVKLVNDLLGISHINVTGLMTIGPFLPDPEQSRPAFRQLRGIKENVNAQGIPLQHLSMGMTNDFEVAIEEGATMVRIGTAIFGKRMKQL